MNTKLKVTLITIVFAVISFLLGPILWPMNEGGVAPASAQLVLLIGVSIIESIAFGLGISFLILGWPMVRSVAHGSTFTAWSLYLGAAWYLVSWWPHDRLHMSISHDDFTTLIKLEYGFHVTLIIAGGFIAYGFFDVMKWYKSHTGK